MPFIFSFFVSLVAQKSKLVCSQILPTGTRWPSLRLYFGFLMFNSLLFRSLFIICFSFWSKWLMCPSVFAGTLYICTHMRSNLNNTQQTETRDRLTFNLLTLMPARCTWKATTSRRPSSYLLPQISHRHDIGSSLLVYVTQTSRTSTHTLHTYSSHASARRWCWVMFNASTNTITGHIGDGFLRVKWPNQQCQSTEGRS